MRLKGERMRRVFLCLQENFTFCKFEATPMGKITVINDLAVIVKPDRTAIREDHFFDLSRIGCEGDPAGRFYQPGYPPHTEYDRRRHVCISYPGPHPFRSGNALTGNAPI